MLKLQTKIISFIKNKRINVFFVFLMFSFIILIISKLSRTYTSTIPFQIETVNIPQEYVILNDSLVLNITLKTHGFKWLTYYFSKPKIRVDFTKDVVKDDKVFVYHKSKAFLNNLQFSDDVELLNLSPEKLMFRYGVNLVKKVPIKINATVNYSLGYNTPTYLYAEPDSVVIVGPDILVSKIDYLETEKKTFKNVRTDLNEKLKLKLPKNKSNLKFSETQTILKAKVEKFTEGTLKIPVTLINVPDNIVVKIFPKEVSVSYYVSLSRFKSITNKDFKVVCDYEKITKNQSFLVPELTKYPQGVNHSKINQQRIEFIITK